MPSSASTALQRRHALQHRIEFRQFGQLVLLDDVAREIARQHELNLAGHRLGVERRALFVALAVRAQEHVFTAVDQDARFGLVARRDQVDGDERQHEREQRRDDDPAALARQRSTDQAQIEIASDRRASCSPTAPESGGGRHDGTSACALSTFFPARQNAKRMVYSRETQRDRYPTW